jgi:hypothetical protein
MDDEVAINLNFTSMIDGFRFQGFSFIYFVYQDSAGNWQAEEEFYHREFIYTITDGNKISIEYTNQVTYQGDMNTIVATTPMFESPTWYNFTIGVNRDGERFIALNNEIFYAD